MTPQQKMQSFLEGIGLPYAEIKCYGSQITVECLSRETAQKWASLLIGAKIKVRGTIRVWVNDKVNTRSVMNPSCHEAWRVYARV